MALRRKVVIGKLTDIPLGQSKSFRYGQMTGIAIRHADGLRAYVNRCSHMGGPVELARDGSTLRCRWHQAEFDPMNGRAVEGQAPQGSALTPIEVSEEAGQWIAWFELPDDPFSF